MKSLEVKRLRMRNFISTKMVKNMIITCLFEKTTEKTTNSIISSSEEDARQLKRIIEK